MATKELQTRIALKYDTYAHWTDESKEGVGANFVLLKGEIGICAIEAQRTSDPTVQTPTPTVLFKVGDGTSPFKSLKWASALAADVYSWAKKSEDEFKTWLNETAEFATDAEVKAITDSMSEKIAALEAKFTGEDSVEALISTAKQEAIDTAAADATSKANAAQAAAEATAATDATSKANAAEANAKSYVDDKVSAQATKDAAQDKLISDNATAIENEAKTRDDADNAINAKFGADYSDKSTVAAAIADAKKAGTDAGQAIIDLTNGAVKDNADAIEDANTKIARVEGLVTAEAKAREDADKAIDERLDVVEAFFETTEGETLDTALDTLKEIQDYLNGEGEATGGMIGRVAVAEKDIEALEGRMDVAEDAINEHAAEFAAYQTTMTNALAGKQDTIAANTYDAYGAAEAVKTYVDGDFKTAIESYADGKASEAEQAAATTLSDAVSTLSAKDAELERNIGTLQDIVNGYSAKSSIKEAIDAAQDAANTAQDGVDAINTVLNGTNNDGLVTRVTALEDVVGDEKDGLVADVATNTAAIAQEKTDRESAISDLNTIISDLDTAYKTADISLIDRINAIVNTTIPATQKAAEDYADAKVKELADGQVTTNKNNIAAIQADYLKAADTYVFNCGNSGVEN